MTVSTAIVSNLWMHTVLVRCTTYWSILCTNNKKQTNAGFDWLARLAKRNEQFDIVILDPPSTSVGKKKKRWSVKSDMDELVALAAPLVKKGGLLMTTTNSATLRPERFAKMIKKGLEDAGIQNAKLERLSPMPSDFPSIGTQHVTNLSWRIPWEC